MGNKDTYFVAVKVFLLDSEGNFLIIKDRFGDWDMPGGRLREQDFNVPLELVVERKMKEEIGGNVKYKLGGPVVFMRHERDEILSSEHREKRRIFAVGYTAQYESGEVMLGKNHNEYEWVLIKTFKPKTRFTGGWLQGIRDFQAGHKEFLWSEK
jgi:ADP-ribose pyrophosphatase YjhB (NUDIX family)